MNPNNTNADYSDSGQVAFEKALQDKLMGQSDAISSSQTGIEASLDKAISAREQATVANAGVIESKFGREIGYAKDEATQKFTETQEGERGFGRNMMVYRQMAEDTDKSLKDMEQRKQELIMQNNASGADAISGLQMNALKFKQEAMQSTFSNLLGMSNWSTQRKQQQMAERTQSFSERSQVAGVALKYGVSVKSGDTLEMVLGKIPAGSVTKEEAANLARMASETRLNNARASEALNGTLPVSSDPDSILGFANAARMSPNSGNVLGTLTKQPGVHAAVITKMAEMEVSDINALGKESVNLNMPIETVKAMLAKDPKRYERIGLNGAEKIIEDHYKTQLTKPKEKRTLGKDVGAIKESTVGIGRSIGSYLFGDDFGLTSRELTEKRTREFQERQNYR